MKSSVELISGPYRSGKSRLLLEKISDYLSRGPLTQRPVIITVPSKRYQRLLEAQLKEMSLSGTAFHGGYFGIKILPFYELCHYVLHRLEVNFRIVPEGLRPAFLVKAMERLAERGALESLRAIHHLPGTHKGMLELIDELERAGLSPFEVLASLSKKAASTSRHVELARVYEAYWAELEGANLYDERKLAYKTREVLSALTGNILGFGILAVDGFDRFNKLQTQVLAALSRQAEHNIVCFDFVEEDKVAEAGCLKSGARESLAVNHLDYRWKDKSRDDLVEAFSGDFISTIVPRVTQISPLVSRFKTIDRFSEMDEIARSVKTRLAQGVSPEEILVVVRSLKPYQAAVRASFDKAQVPFYVDEAVELGSIPLVRFVSRLLHLPSSKVNFKRREVLLTLASPFFRQESLSFTENDLLNLDRLSLEKSVVEGKNDWSEFPLVASFIALFEDFSVEQTLTDFVAKVETLLERLVVLPSDDEYSSQILAWEEHQALRELKSIFSNLIMEESLLGSHYGVEKIDYDAFLQVFGRSVDSANFRRYSSSKNCVTICSADLVPNKSFDYMYLAGLIEGEFPRRGERTGFLSKDEVRQWASFDIDIDNPRHHESFELSLFTSLIERCCKELHLSQPEYELSGEELVPSFFLTSYSFIGETTCPLLDARQEALRRPMSRRDLGEAHLWTNGARALELSVAVAEAAVELDDASGAAVVSSIAHTTSVGNEFAFQANANVGGNESAVQANANVGGSESAVSANVRANGLVVSRALRELREFYQPITEAINFVRGRTEYAVSSEINGFFVEQVALGLVNLARPAKFSVSRLNAYGKCPFAYWISHELGFRREEEPTPGLNIQLKGEVNHKILELFYLELQASGRLLSSLSHEERDSRLKVAIDAGFRWLEKERSFSKSLFYAYEKKEIAFRLGVFIAEEQKRFLNEGNRFIPTYFEASFGMPERRAAAAGIASVASENIDAAFTSAITTTSSSTSSLPSIATADFLGANTLAFPAVIVDAPSGPVIIRGRIDRIDLADEGRIARVVDYKSGSSPIRISDAEEGCNMQLPVYAMAVAQGARTMHSGVTASTTVGGVADHDTAAGLSSNSAADANAYSQASGTGTMAASSFAGVSPVPRFASIVSGLQVESGVYLSVSSGGSNGSINFQESVETLGKVQEKIAEFADRIRRGDFKIAPNDPQACKTCDHFSVCRISELASGRENEEEEA